MFYTSPIITLSLQSLNDIKYTVFSIYLIRNHEHIANITYSPSIIYSLGPETKLGIPTLVGVGVGKFSSTPTPARSRSRLQHFFIISFLVKLETNMEIEHYVLSADSHDGLPCKMLLLQALRLFPGELAFNHRSRLDNHNQQRHSLWDPVTWPCLINFGGVTG